MDNDRMSELKQILNKWWNEEEPFGFDNPDTYNGILKCMQEARKGYVKLEDVIKTIEQYHYIEVNSKLYRELKKLGGGK